MLIVWLSTSSCLTWQAASEPPELLIERERPESVRLTLDNGDVLVLPGPTVGNRVVTAADGRSAGLGEIRTLEVRRFHIARTVGLGALISALALTWTAAFADNQGGDVIILPPEPK